MYRTDSYSSYGGGFGGGGGRFGNNKRSDDIVLKKAVWNSSTMKPFDRDFYRETSQAKLRLQSEVDAFLDANRVTFRTDSYIRPVLDFNDFSIPDTILSQFRKANYDKPTPIQATCWPTLMSGQNIVGIAQTGSGKTLGFLLPILIHIQNNQRYLRTFGRDDPPGPIALVLAPTRELAQQIQKVADDFGTLTGIRNVVVYGGASKGYQITQIRRGPEICIATPGRLLDLLSDNCVSLNRCTFLVLDEADRMLDMGFEPQIRKIFEQIRPDRQIAMFSATWPKEVRKLAEDFLGRYSQVTIGAAELTANPNIKQHVEMCEEREKEGRLREILKEIMSQRDSKTIIFAETKRRVDNYSKYIRDLGYFCLAIHGDKKQQEREWVLSEFKKKSRAILIATDVAARGINIEDIRFVINIDFPNQTEDYIHRIGRTARSTNSGTSYTFLTQDNAKHVPKLIEVMRDAKQVISEELMNFGNRFGRGRFGGPSRYGSSSGGGYGGRSNGYSNGSSSSYGAQKRSYGESSGGGGDYGNSVNNGYGASSSSAARPAESSDGRVKKFRWDSGPAAPAASANGTNAYGTSTGAASASYANGSAAPKQAYGPYPTQSYSSAPPPPPPPENGAAAKPATAAAGATPAAGAAPYYSATDYAAYNLQYYQAMAAAAAQTNWTQAAAAYAAAGWKAPTA